MVSRTNEQRRGASENVSSTNEGGFEEVGVWARSSRCWRSFILDFISEKIWTFSNSIRSDNDCHRRDVNARLSKSSRHSAVPSAPFLKWQDSFKVIGVSPDLAIHLRIPESVDELTWNSRRSNFMKEQIVCVASAMPLQSLQTFKSKSGGIFGFGS